MHKKTMLSVEDAQLMISAVAGEARKNDWRVSVAVVDDGGHLLAMRRDDGAPPASASICEGKARTAALGKKETKFFEDMINKGRAAFLSAPGFECMIEGGVPVFVEGACIGAVGVSGVQSHDDAELARAGIAALLALGHA